MPTSEEQFHQHHQLVTLCARLEARIKQLEDEVMAMRDVKLARLVEQGLVELQRERRGGL